MNRVKPQVVKALVGKQIVQVNFGYILPAPDLRFIRYVSWPFNIGDPTSVFRFVIHHDVWPSIKRRIESLGYEVNEKDD